MAEDISVLGIAVETRGVKEGADALDKLTASGKKAEQSTAELSTEAKKTSSVMSDLAKAAVSSAVAFGSLATIKGIAMAMIEAQQAAQKLRNSLEYSAGSAAGASKEIGYLRDITRTLGLDFTTAASAYSKFAASTKESGISASQTKTVFEGIAEASAKMGLSADETGGALLALSQMASKGTVNAEELRGQLAERLPGAFNIAAKAMGVTTAELGKMMERGELMASDFLPRFGQALKDNFQAPVNSITQEINRLNSAWDLWKTELSDGANGDGIGWLTKGINESTASMRALGKEAGIVMKILAASGGFQAGALGASKFDTAAVQQKAMQQLPEIRNQRQSLESKDYLTQFEKQTLADLKRQEAALRESINDLAVRKGKETGSSLPDIAGEYAAQQKKQNDKLAAYLKDTSNAPKAVKIAAEVEKENTSFKVATAGLLETDAKYISALRAHNDRVAEISKQPKAVGDGGVGKSTLSFDIDRIKQEGEAMTSAYASSEKIMTAMRSANLISEAESFAAKSAFLQLNAEANENSVQQQIDRMQQEKLTGKASIDNAKAIMDAEAQLQKVREAATAAKAANDIQAQAAAERAIQSYRNATDAASEYLAAVRRQNDRELDGIGKGTVYRKEQSDQNRIEDKYLASQSSLLSDSRTGKITDEEYAKYLALAKQTYDAEVAEHARSRSRIMDAEEDWSKGMTEALANYAESSRNAALRSSEAWTSSIKSMEDALVSFVTTGKLDFKSLADTIIAEMARTQIRQMLGGASGGIAGLMGSSATTGYEVSSDTMFSSAGSGILGWLSSIKHSGGIVGTGEGDGFRSVDPRVFHGASKYHTGGIVDGEVPIIAKRGEGVFTKGQMAAMGGGSSSVSVTVNNTASDKVESTVKPKMNNGRLELEVMIAQVLAKDMRNNGSITQGLSSTFNLSRAT